MHKTPSAPPCGTPHPAPDALYGYLQGHKSALTEDIETHVSDCPECHSWLADFRQQIEATAASWTRIEPDVGLPTLPFPSDLPILVRVARGIAALGWLGVDAVGRLATGGLLVPRFEAAMGAIPLDRAPSDWSPVILRLPFDPQSPEWELLLTLWPGVDGFTLQVLALAPATSPVNGWRLTLSGPALDGPLSLVSDDTGLFEVETTTLSRLSGLRYAALTGTIELPDTIDALSWELTDPRSLCRQVLNGLSS